ncbi:MAG: alpha/beta hydrolase [Desulfobacterales bacterium]
MSDYFLKISSLLFFLSCFVMTGCTLVQLKEDIDQSLASTVIVGRVQAAHSKKGPIIVAARPVGQEKKIAHYTVLHESGEYELMVAQGAYTVFAYRDDNRNLVYDDGEPAGQYGAPDPVRAPSVGVVFDINIVVPENGNGIAAPYGLRIAPVSPEALRSRQAGAVVDLDDERFSEHYGVEGFWEPISFFRKMGGNIYFLEDYDPEKTPILFIHGATGTPKGWRYFADHIDRNRFQPWFFYYPTGARIDSMSYLLYWKLVNLQRKYQFNRIYITAHSMGGLVARSFIVNYGRKFPCVKLFISLATPWGGDPMAEYGVRQSPVVIPSWIDMQPDGDFIQSLYRLKMPESVRFYMFYGYRGSRTPFGVNNDGTSPLASLQDRRPQSEAEMNFAFDEDHTSLLSSKAVLSQYKTILDAVDERRKAAGRRSGGYLKVRVDYTYDIDSPRPLSTLILRRDGEEDAETVTHLSERDNGKILGPFPPGTYSASIVTVGGRPTEKVVPVSILKDRSEELNFVIVPDGEVRGCVTASLNAEDRHVGMPDYRFRSADRKIHLQSITLEGSGIHRTLQAAEGEEIVSDDYLISRSDFCYNRCFGFFGLPGGNYTLKIEARGYEPIVIRYSVVPGTPKYFRMTELTLDRTGGGE